MRPIACETCMFWVAYDTKREAGNCHRHAPAIFDRGWSHPEFGQQNETATEWPQTVRAEWCGDHAFNKETTL